MDTYYPKQAMQILNMDTSSCNEVIAYIGTFISMKQRIFEINKTVILLVSIIEI